MSPHIVLREAGVPYQLEKVDLRTHTTAGGADFYGINPKGYVPALQFDDGRVLTEGPAIIQYLADRAPESKLVPAAGTFERAQLQEWLNYISAELHKTLGAFFNPKLLPEVRQSTLNILDKKFDYLSKQLAGRTFLLGDTFSVADAYLYTILRWTDRFKIDVGKWPVLQAYMARVASRPAVQASLKEEGLS